MSYLQTIKGYIRRYESVISTILIILIALTISLTIRFFVLQSSKVAGESMEPSYHNGDFLLIDKISYTFSSPKRGDVIVLKHPMDPSGHDLVKRIIGLPNETVIIEDGVVKIQSPNNDQLRVLEEPYITTQTCPDVFCNDLNLSSQFQMSKDEYFVLGDNRTNSTDSRDHFKPIHKDLIIGKVFVRLLPLGNISLADTPTYSLE